MSSVSPKLARSPFGRRRVLRQVTGRATSAGPNFAFLATFIVPLWLTGLAACGSDNSSPAQPTGAVGAAELPDASVRDLPGDGLEQTPDFDIDSRQRDPIGPEELTERIEQIQNGGAPARNPSADAGNSSPDGSDAGAVNGTN